MRTSVLRTGCRDLTYELVGVLYKEWQLSWHQLDFIRTAKKVPGYIAIVIAIALAISVILYTPQYDSVDRHPIHRVVNGLNIALPDNLRGFAIEQLVPLP
jgi:hypothetical protein